MSSIEKRNNTSSSNKLMTSSSSSLISHENENPDVKFNLYKFDKSIVYFNNKKQFSNDKKDSDYHEFLSDEIKGINKKTNNLGYFNLFECFLTKLRRKFGLIIALIFFILVILITLYLLYISILIFLFILEIFFGQFGHENDEICNGVWHQKNTCSLMEKNQIVGTMCMDICYLEAITMPRCVTFDLEINDSGSTYKFYLINDVDSSFIMPTKMLAIEHSSKILEEGSMIDEIKIKLSNIIKNKLNETTLIDKTIERLIEFVDVNKDKEINYAEASTLWSLLNMKHTFFMLVLANKAYIPTINNFCGSIIEIEQIRNQVVLDRKKSLFSIFFNHDRRIGMPPLTNEYKAKISIGILEFYLDIISFNPNDEFGPSSLHLCSPIESSFGYNFYNEAKLLNFDDLYSGKELEEKMSDRRCLSNLDCVYSKECSMKCDLNTNKCTHEIIKPQIIDYCLFLRDYLEDHPNITNLEPIIDKCLNLKNLYIKNEKILFDKNEMPINFNRHKSYIETSNYWKNSLEFTTVTNELSSALWDLIKFSKDPVKKKEKKTTKKN